MKLIFKEVSHETFNYQYHQPNFANDYVLENGVYQFAANDSDNEILVTLETAQSYLMNDYSFPDPDYTVTSVKINDVDIEIDSLKESHPEIYAALTLLDTKYSQDPEDYVYELLGQAEDNYSDKLSNASYEDLKAMTEKGFIVEDCKPKSI